MLEINSLQKQKKKEYDRMRYQMNRDYFRIRNKNNYEKNKTHYLQQNKEYNSRPEIKQRKKLYYQQYWIKIKDRVNSYRRSPEYSAKRRVHRREYYKKNHSHILDYMRDYSRFYAKTHPEKYLEYRKKSLQALGENFNLGTYDYLSAINHWSNMIKTRDGACKVCGNTKKLHAHHIFEKHLYPILSLNKNNGITLCVSCHDEVHGRNLINFS